MKVKSIKLTPSLMKAMGFEYFKSGGTWIRNDLYITESSMKDFTLKEFIDFLEKRFYNKGYTQMQYEIKRVIGV